MDIEFDPTFMAKTRVPSDPSTHQSSLHIPALAPSLDEELSDFKMCPVRALRAYLLRTRNIRPKGANLFISFGPGKPRPISKVTLSNWIRQVVRAAHTSASDEDSKFVSRTTHELRAIATSVLFSKSQSLNSVMQAACWKSHSTFSNFYLRDLSHMTDDLISLGPIVSAQEVVNFSK